MALPFAGTALTRQVLRPHLAATLAALDASLPELPVGGGGGDEDDSDADEAAHGGGGGGSGMRAVTEVLAMQNKIQCYVYLLFFIKILYLFFEEM